MPEKMPATSPLALEVECPRCDGRGHYDEGDGEHQRCAVCDGAGYMPTEFGRRILGLMRHNFRPMFDDMRAD